MCVERTDYVARGPYKRYKCIWLRCRIARGQDNPTIKPRKPLGSFPALLVPLADTPRAQLGNRELTSV